VGPFDGDEHQIAVFRNVEAIDEHKRRALARDTLGAGTGLPSFSSAGSELFEPIRPCRSPTPAANDSKSFMPTNNRPASRMRRRRSVPLTHQT
jgi:hypothetical protein